MTRRRRHDPAPGEPLSFSTLPGVRALLETPRLMRQLVDTAQRAVDTAEYATHEMARLRGVMQTIATTPGLDGDALRAIAKGALDQTPEPPPERPPTPDDDAAEDA